MPRATSSSPDICVFLAEQGKLVGYGIEEQLPTVAIAAHYDAFGVAPVNFLTVCFLACILL